MGEKKNVVRKPKYFKQHNKTISPLIRTGAPRPSSFFLAFFTAFLCFAAKHTFKLYSMHLIVHINLIINYIGIVNV